MTLLRILEILCSLSLQVTVVVLATGCLIRVLGRTERFRDQLWTGCFLAVLLVCVGDFCLPHLRLLPVPATLVDRSGGATLEKQANWIGGLVALWLAGTIFMLGRLAVGSIRAGWLLRRSIRICPSDLPQPWGERHRRNGRCRASRNRFGHSLSGDARNSESFLLAVAAADYCSARDLIDV